MEVTLDSPITAISTDRYSRILAAATKDGKISIYDANTNNLISNIILGDLTPTSLSFSSDDYGSMLAVGFSNGNVFIYVKNAGKYSLTSKFELHQGCVSCVSFHSTLPLLASTSLDGTFGVYSYNGSWTTSTYPASQLGLTALAWGSNSKDTNATQVLFLGSVEGTISYWYISPGSVVWEKLHAIQVHNGWVLSMSAPSSFSTATTKVATVGDDRRVAIIKFDGNSLVSVSSQLSTSASDVSWAMVDKTVVVSCDDGNILSYEEDKNGNLVLSN